MHPSAGAVAVGARPFLIAYNINLEFEPTWSWPSGSPGGSANRAAGCRASRPTGFWIEELGRAQVSMNLLDFATTPLWLVWDTVRDLAAEDGVSLAESELIGLAPLAAFLAVADRAGAPSEDTVERRLASAAAYLRLRDFSPMQALELRLEAARAAAPRRERRPVQDHPRRSKRRADAGPPDRGGLGGRDPCRRRPGGASPGARSAGCRRPTSVARRPRRPDRRVLGGPDRGGRPARGRGDSARGRGLPARALRPDRRRRRRA